VIQGRRSLGSQRLGSLGYGYTISETAIVSRKQRNSWSQKLGP
jgi:hypothetical protein